LAGDDVTRLAAEALVPEHVVRTVAPRVDEQPVWRSVLDDVQAVDRVTDGRVREVSLGLACKGLNGEIRTEDQLWSALVQQLVGLSEPQLRAAYSATVELWRQLHAARASSDPNQRAAVAIACYTVQKLNAAAGYS
jgi:hypothetical protein